MHLLVAGGREVEEHLCFSIHHHFSCQNLPIDGVRELAEEYTTKMATIFTILTNTTLLNLPSQGGFAPWTPLIGRVLNRGAPPVKVELLTRAEG